jgi:hypothetical protein
MPGPDQVDCEPEGGPCDPFRPDPGTRQEAGVGVAAFLNLDRVGLENGPSVATGPSGGSPSRDLLGLRAHFPNSP